MRMARAPSICVLLERTREETFVKLYAALVVGIALGATLALIIAARELEDAPATLLTTMPASPPTGAPGQPMGA